MTMTAAVTQRDRLLRHEEDSPINSHVGSRVIACIGCPIYESLKYEKRCVGR